MSEWSYHVEEYNLGELKNPDYLNALGQIGWELVCLDRLTGAERTTTKWVAVFKKRIEEKQR